MFSIRTVLHRYCSMDFYSMFVLKLSQCFPCQRLGHLLHQIIPCKFFGSAVDVNHRDTLIDRTDNETEPASNAIVFTHFRLIFSIMWKDVDALVRGVITGNIAKIALDAF